METKEKFWIYRTQGTVKDMQELDYGFITKENVIVLYDSKQQKHFRAIKLDAIVYANDPWGEGIYIECKSKNKSQDEKLLGENYYLESVPGISLFDVKKDFDWQTGNYTTPVEIEVELEPEPEEGFEIYEEKVDEEGDFESNYYYISPNSPLEELQKARNFFSQREEYEKCIIIQKWIEKKQKEGK